MTLIDMTTSRSVPFLFRVISDKRCCAHFSTIRNNTHTRILKSCMQPRGEGAQKETCTPSGRIMKRHLHLRLVSNKIPLSGRQHCWHSVDRDSHFNTAGMKDSREGGGRCYVSSGRCITLHQKRLRLQKFASMLLS